MARTPQPRSASEILADLQALDRQNDRLELGVALARQSLKAAEAHASSPQADPEAIRHHLNTAACRLRGAG